MNTKAKGYIAGILAAVFYGTNPLGALPLYDHGFTSGNVLFYRYGLATIFFAVWMLIRKEKFSISRGYAIKFSLLGAMFALSSILLFASFLFMNAGVASTILFSYPIMTALLMVIFYREHITTITVISLALAIGGIGLLYRGDGQETLSVTGVLLVLGSSLLFAIYIVYAKQFKIKMSPVKSTFWIIFFGWIVIVGYMFFTGDSVQLPRQPIEWGCIVLLALMPTLLSLYFLNISIQSIGSTLSSILGALEPVTAVVISTFVFGELFTVRLAIGIVLILSAVLLIIGGNGMLKKLLHNNV